MSTAATPQGTIDRQYMAQALRLAQLGERTTTPNPQVGCLLVSQGRIIGAGFHRRAGEGHAEVNALAAVAQPDQPLLKTATAYVTLEPCSHHGRTGPCCEALAGAGVARVVYAMEDPNPNVRGRGIQYLQAAGIAVDGPVLSSQAQAINRGFIKRMTVGRPWVTVKLAMSLDGRTAMASGESQWITGSDARAQVQALRARACAVVSGWQTVRHDQARLSVREQQLPSLPVDAFTTAFAQAPLRQPMRVVVDSTGQLSGCEPFFAEPGRKISANAAQIRTKADDIEHWHLPDGNGRVNLAALLDRLADQQCNNVLVEAGATLAGAFVRQGLVDELIAFVAPTLMGSSGRPLLELPIHAMAEQLPLRITDVRAVGRDWQITAMLDKQTES